MGRWEEDDGALDAIIYCCSFMPLSGSVALYLAFTFRGIYQFPFITLRNYHFDASRTNIIEICDEGFIIFLRSIAISSIYTNRVACVYLVEKCSRHLWYDFLITLSRGCT